MTASPTIPAEPAHAAAPVHEHAVPGGGGTRLHVREWGDPAGPGILFVHGWSQADACWNRQVGGPLADRFHLVTMDLRGHGRSDKPPDPASYGDGRLWADDIAAVISATGLDRPVIVAWSYGGLVVGDYLRVHGGGAIAGVDLVGAAVMLRPPAFGHIGPGFLENVGDLCQADLETSVPALRRFLHASTVEPFDDEQYAAALCWNMLTPPAVRAALVARDVDVTGALAASGVPILVTHGRRDTVVLPAMSEHVVASCPAARASWYEACGHLPFIEEAARFDRELSAFADSVAASCAGVSS
jgi:pimeloyl-ACP methyl ester carboxylesterase